MNHSFAKIQLEMFSTDIPGVLRLLKHNEITIYDVERLDELTMVLTVSRQDYKRLQGMKKINQSIKVRGLTGVHWYLKSVMKRPVLVFCVLVLLIATAILPTRILFVQVSGNETLPQNYILEQVNNCGIGFGVSRRAIRSEQIKNDLIERIPGIKWAAVTTSGCVATIHVEEGSSVQPKEQDLRPGNIVAAQDSVVQEVNVTKGSPVCKPGDAVIRGQVLISGYTDCGRSILVTRAQGEVYGRTLRSVCMIAPKPTEQLLSQNAQKTRFSLLVGKKLIKLYKDSGISHSTCVKIYSYHSVDLPGGYSLPITLVKETVIPRETISDIGPGGQDWLADSARGYVTGQMLAGSILDEHISIQETDEAYCLEGTYDCREMIGLFNSEEILKGDGQSDGTGS